MSTARKQRLLSFFTLVLCLLGPSFEKPARAQAPEDKPDSPVPLVRPCVARSENLKTTRKVKTKEKTETNCNAFAPGCLEAKDSPLNIQEFFESYVRAQAWRFGEEKIVADGWVFVRYLDRDELLQFAKEGYFAGHVNWTEGKAVVLVATRELDDGYTRVEVSARVQGFGQNVDRFAPARDSWDLDSTGLLEKNLLTALEAHFKSLQSSPQN